MNILIVGSGGRENALAWKAAQSPKADKIYCAPGNAGIARYAECVDLSLIHIWTVWQSSRWICWRLTFPALT